MKLRVLFTILVVSVVMAPGLRAQEQTEEEDERVLVGRVVDGQTGSPLLGSFISLEGETWGVLSDEGGYFRLPDVPEGRFPVEVEHLGYVDFVQEVAPSGGEVVTLALTPDPILLEGIEVVQDRFETRRKAYPFASKVVSRDELVFNASSDLAELISHRSFLRPFPCPDLSAGFACAVIRGRMRRVTVWVDEFPAMGGFDYLTTLAPHELHRVEIYPSKGVVLAYTEAFMERAGKRPMALMPLRW